MGVKINVRQMLGMSPKSDEGGEPELQMLDLGEDSPVPVDKSVPAPEKVSHRPEVERAPFDPSKCKLSHVYAPEAKKTPVDPDHRQFAIDMGYGDDPRNFTYVHEWLYQLRLVWRRQQMEGYPNVPVDPEDPPCQIGKQFQLLDWLGLRYPGNPDKYTRFAKLMAAAKVKFKLVDLKEHAQDKTYPKVTEAEAKGANHVKVRS